MAFIYGSIPFFECMVRREYTRNHEDGHGQYLKAVAHAVRCVRGHSLWFQTILTDQFAGAAFMVPIEALVWKPCEKPDEDMTYIQPWDVFSSTFGVCEVEFVARGAVHILPARMKAQYRFTIDFSGSDLADHVEQHKHLHVCFIENGLVGAFPNNRILWDDPAFWTATTERPDFKSLGGEYRAEGHQALMRSVPADNPNLNGSAPH